MFVDAKGHLAYTKGIALVKTKHPFHIVTSSWFPILISTAIAGFLVSIVVWIKLAEYSTTPLAGVNVAIVMCT